MGPHIARKADLTMSTDPISDNVTLVRLNDQIAWYDGKSKYNQRVYKALRISTVILAALIPFAAGFHAMAGITGSLGVLVVVIESFQSINQYHAHWISYRSTCEYLKHDKYLYFAKAGPYSTAADPHVLLAERVESLVSQEHAKWASGHQEAEKSKTPLGTRG